MSGSRSGLCHCSFWCSGLGLRIYDGWLPQDDAEARRAEHEGITADPVSERYQGGAYTVMEYSRSAPSPRDYFALE